MDIDSFAKRNREKIQMFLVFLLVLCLGFSSGYYYRDERGSEGGITIQEASGDCSRLFNVEATGESPSRNEIGSVEGAKIQKAESLSKNSTEIKAFAGSKNSNLYHKATCQYVKRIKEENIVWFSSAEEAEKAGRKPHSCIYE